MDKYKVNRIVEFIRSYGDFPYDTNDVIEVTDGILNSYGTYDALTRDEYFLLVDEFLELAEQSEIREAVRWASLQLVCGQDLRFACDYRLPGYIW